MGASSEGFTGGGADLGGVDRRGEGNDFGGSGCGGILDAEGSGLDGDEAGTAAGGLVCSVEAALHELAGENGAVGKGYYVTDEHLAEAGGQSGRIVAHLIGVREDCVRWTFGLDQLLKSQRVSISRVLGEERMLDADDFGDGAACDFGGESCGVCAEKDGGDG